MRVAHVITRLILGGAQENTVLCCLDLLRRHGDEVLLVTGPGLGPEGDLEPWAREEKVPLAILPELRRTIHLWRDARAYYAIRRELLAFRPEVVHTHSGKAGLLGRMAAWSLKIPAIVHTVHGAPFHPYQGRAGRALFRQCECFAARRCHKIVSVADAMTELMVEAGVAPREKFITIASGMDVTPFVNANDQREQTRAEFGFGEEDIVVGKIARLFPLKGHDDLIAAARLVVAKNPAVKFLLVGDGILRSRIERDIESAGLSQAFRLTGLVARNRIPAMLGASDLVVHASLREGLARVLPQALLASKPVLSYDIDGAREVVIPNETGHLLAPRDVSGMADAILALAGDAASRERMGAIGRERCIERFDYKQMSDQLRGLYTEILESPRPAALFRSGAAE